MNKALSGEVIRHNSLDCLEVRVKVVSRNITVLSKKEEESNWLSKCGTEGMIMNQNKFYGSGRGEILWRKLAPFVLRMFPESI